MSLREVIMRISHILYTSSLSILMLVLGACARVSFDNGSLQQSSTSIDDPPPGGVIKDSYFFVKRAADILFVIDTSGSMAEEQALLKSGFPSFTSTINDYSGGTLDWHIAITTTDVANAGMGNQGSLKTFSSIGPNTYYLDSSMNGNTANIAFQNTVTLGTTGSGDERGIAAARMMVAREVNPATSVGFMRPDTPLSIIVLSDEDERSTRDTSSAEYMPLEAIDEPGNFLSGIRTADTMSNSPKTVTFHSIVTSSQACLSGAGAYMGTTYMQLSALTNGIVGDICALSGSYQEQLKSMAVNIVNEARTYTLPCNNILAGSASIYEQTLNGVLVLVPSTFLPPNKLVLQNPPAVGSLIKAHFTCMD